MLKNTINKRINAISTHLLQNLIVRIKDSLPFAIQLDETTDKNKFSQVIVYVCYCFNENIYEDMLFCHAIEGGTGGEDKFF